MRRRRGTVVLERWYANRRRGARLSVPGSFDDESEGRVYHAVAAGDLYPPTSTCACAPAIRRRLPIHSRDLSASIDPDVQFRRLHRRNRVQEGPGHDAADRHEPRAGDPSVILLSSAGIYSLMSFTVAQRRREIGIRAALGANRNRILVGIFSRVLAQLGCRRSPRLDRRGRPGADPRR